MPVLSSKISVPKLAVHAAVCKGLRSLYRRFPVSRIFPGSLYIIPSVEQQEQIKSKAVLYSLRKREENMSEEKEKGQADGGRTDGRGRRGADQGAGLLGITSNF